MMYYFIINLWFAFSSLLVPSVRGLNTTIAISEIFSLGPRRIAEHTQNFKEFVMKSTIFVDKSLLIKELLSDTTNRITTINYPPHWGKSLNLHMLKTFLEVEINEKGDLLCSSHNQTRNYRLFKNGEIIADNGEVVKLKNPLLISQHDDIIEDFQGKKPVIYFNLTDLNPGTGFDNLYKEIVNRISDTFTEHEYMKRVLKAIADNTNKPEPQRALAEKNLKTFERILSKVANSDDIERSFNFLSEILHEHFKERVYILVDSYDAPYNNTFLCGTYPRSHEQLFLDFYRRFIYYSYLSNPSLKKAILTGVLPIADGDLLLSLNGAKEITIFNSTYLHHFYGFSRPETNGLFTLFRVSNKTIDEAYQFYDSYTIGFPNKTNFMEPLSIVRILNSGQFIRRDVQFCTKYLTVDSIRFAAHTLVTGLQLPVDFTKLVMNRADFMHLQNASYYNEISRGPMLRAFLKYSFAIGYLSLTSFEFLDSFCARYATGDMFATSGEQLEVYYAKKFGFDLETIRPICKEFPNHLMDFIKSEEDLSSNLTSNLESFFSHIIRPYGFVTNENEETIFHAMNYLSIFVKSLRRYPSYGTEILLFDKDIGVSIKTSFNSSSPEETCHKAKRSRSKFKPLNFPKIRLIGINVKPNSTVEVLGDIWQPVPVDELH